MPATKSLISVETCGNERMRSAQSVRHILKNHRRSQGTPSGPDGHQETAFRQRAGHPAKGVLPGMEGFRVIQSMNGRSIDAERRSVENLELKEHYLPNGFPKIAATSGGGKL